LCPPFCFGHSVSVVLIYVVLIYALDDWYMNHFVLKIQKQKQKKTNSSVVGHE